MYECKLLTYKPLLNKLNCLNYHRSEEVSSCLYTADASEDEDPVAGGRNVPLDSRGLHLLEMTGECQVPNFYCIAVYYLCHDETG
jgi:hypothetical protein